MAPKKNQKPNGFLMFTMEWKKRYGKYLSLPEATEEAGKIWSTMNDDQRKPYKDMAREAKQKGPSTNDETRYTCHGVPLSQMEKEKKEIELKERMAKRHIEQTVKQSVKQGELEHQKYFFIMINHFAKTLNNGSYIPAELGLCEFSLKSGVARLYHTLINPNIKIYGCHFDAQSYSESTHNLPLPPNALGETNLSNVYEEVLKFIGASNDKYPPVYTVREYIPIVESTLEFLQADMGASNFKLDIYPIQYLFYIMKLQTCEQGDITNVPTNFHITDVQFEKDLFEYQTGIACEFHEKIDRTKYCAQSLVTRWGYTFADYMCQDIAIQMIPGRHVPQNTRLDAIITLAPSSVAYNEAASFVSIQSNTSYGTKALAGGKLFHDNDYSDNDSGSKEGASYQRREPYDEDDFPALSSSGSYSRHKQSNRKVCQASSKASQGHGSAPSNTKSYERFTHADEDLNDGGSRRINYMSHNAAIVNSRSNYDEEREPDEYSDMSSYVGELNPWSARSMQKSREPAPSDYSVNSSLSNTHSLSSYGRGNQLWKN